MTTVVKLSDYVMEFVAQIGVRHVFMLPGGGAMHLNESLGRRLDIEFVCALHEQAAAIEAEAYAKVANDLSVLMVTSGPGGTNALTGVASAWLDSVPMLVLSGQVKRADLKRDTGVRMLGVQEVDIVSIVRSVTKYAVTVEDPNSIRYHLERAVHLARSGRRGPVWLDIPLDVQAAQVEPGALPGFEPDAEPPPSDVPSEVEALLVALGRAERPVVVVGNGVRAAGATDTFTRVARRLRAPILTTWLGLDLIGDDDPLFAGRPGSIAPRGANFTLQNSDMLLMIGARMDMALTGYAHDKLARQATKAMVYVDVAEIEKMRTPIQMPIVADAATFLLEFERQLEGATLPDWSRWLAQCQSWKRRYPVVQPEYHHQRDGVSTYVLSEAISAELDETAVVASGSSGAAVELFLLSFQAKSGQRVLHSRGMGAMGFGLPASVGACIASGRRPTLCFEGDGSFQMNAQELETIRRLNLPIKVFVVNNNGYASIRASQTNYFGHLVAADPTSGLTLPSATKLAAAYGVSAELISGHDDIRARVRGVLSRDGPVVCEVAAPPTEERAPRLSSMQRPDGSLVSKPIEDLWPFLDRNEFRANMIVEPLED